MNSSLREKTAKYKNEIKSNFKSYNNNTKESIQTKNFNDILNVVNSNKKNKFINDSIKSLISLKQEENDDNISPEEYISYIETKLDNNEKNEGLKNIFNALCDSNNEKISWNSLPQIAKELGDDEMSNNLMNVIKQSKLYLKDLNYEEFLEIMNSESDEEKEDITIKSNKKENNIINNKKKSIDKYPLKYYFYGMLYMKFNYSYKDNNIFFGVSRNFIKSYNYYRRIIDITSYLKMYKEFEIYKKLVLRKETEKYDENIEKNKSGSRNSSQYIRNYLY
jgi:Ca2+-binding EF-hand superfamily protein